LGEDRQGRGMITIIDYGMGNVGSVLSMFRKIGASAVVSREASDLARAAKIVLPGVGGFAQGMRQLEETGLVPLLKQRVLEEGAFLLGICLGLQLLTERSEEGGGAGLGLLRARTVRFRLTDPEHAGLKIPHMGWQAVTRRGEGGWPSLAGAPRFYFVHSYHLDCECQEDVLATAHYGYAFPAAVTRGRIVGTQFHPEKSHKFGMALLRDFVEWA
jgi:glutamine amidotransferase